MVVIRRLTALVALLLVTTLASTSPAQAAESTVIGGQQVYIGQDMCFTGFAVEHDQLGHGFVTSDACGLVGQQVSLPGGEQIGTVRLRMPGWLWVQLSEGRTAAPYVHPDHPVVGAQPPPMGEPVCRSSPVLGWMCGQITATNQTVNLPQGTITGVTRTNLCGDVAPGSPYLANGHAQGVHLAGNGNCSAGVDYFYPLTSMLNAVPQLSLMTV